MASAALFVVAAVGGVYWRAHRSSGFDIPVDPDRNILLVTIDTLRADALGSYGGRAVTPNIDRLAALGARFDFAHSHAVVTLASHASILGGRYPYEHGVRDDTGYRFPQDQPTAATLLKAQGFATGAFIGGFPLDHRFGLTSGFDIYDDNLQGSPDSEDADRERRADAVVHSALDWIAQQRGKWFTWIHVYDPHAPYQPPYEWAAKFPSDPYLGEVSWTDAALAPLFDHLSKEPRPTLVIVTGDHGEGLGDHGELGHGLFAYESTLRVPLIVAVVDPHEPTSEDRGVVISTAVRHVDLLPTMLDVVGAAAMQALPGTSLRPLIAAGTGPDRPSYFEAMSATVTRGWAPLRGVLVERQKYIDLPISELYDLGSDQRETENLASAHSDRTQVLFNTLKAFSVAPLAHGRKESAETLGRLRSLGIGGGVSTVKEQYTEEDDPKRLVEIEQQLTQAADAFRSGRTKEAIETYRSVIIRRPDTEDAYRKLAHAYWRAGQPDHAVATLEDALRAGVTQNEVLIELGQYLTVAGEPGKAIALLEHDAGDDPDALIALGNAYSLAGRSADAVRTFTHVLSLEPKSALAYQNLGTAQLQMGKVAAAEGSLRKAIALNPTLAGAYTALGVVLATSGRRADAIDTWKQAIELDSSEFSALYNLTVNLAEAGRMQEAKTFGERFIATAPVAMSADVEEVRRVLAK